MDQLPSSARFAWVRKRDGRLVPFEADQVSRDLFAAGESLGKPDAFLARELTDSILHFLDAEAGGNIPTTAQISELVIKVVRELGQPELALAFAGAGTPATQGGDSKSQATITKEQVAAVRVGPLLPQLCAWVKAIQAPSDLAWRTARACLREYSLREVYTRDLAAAQSDGLLTLCGLEAPLELDGWVMPTPAAAVTGVMEAIEAARNVAGTCLALDGPQYVLASRGADPGEAAAFVRAVKLGLRLMRLQAVVNLNCADPPPQLGELAMGPLFESFHSAAEPTLVHKLSEAMLDEFLQPESSGGCVRVDWHVGRNDFAPSANPTLLRMARQALEGAPLAFVFDRPRRLISLGEGLDRHHPASLLAVGLHLPRLIEQSGPELDSQLFVKKLGSLARLALSAAKQKRDFLRRHAHTRPALAGSFLVDRARLIVVPIGLEAATQMLLGRGLCSGGSAPEFGRQVVERLRSVLREDGRACLLDTCVDSALGHDFSARPVATPAPEFALREAAGLTSWDVTTTAKSQVRAASVLHGVVEGGTASVLLAEDALPSAEEVVDLLSYAWKQTEVVRVRFVRMVRPAQQLAVPWEK